jgi:hypothetical protein
MKPSAVPSTKHAISLNSIPLLQKTISQLILLPPFPLRQLLQNPPIHRREHRIVPLRPQLRDIWSRQAEFLVHGDELGGLQLGRSAVEGALHRGRGAAFDGREAVDESGDFFCGFLRFVWGRSLLGGFSLGWDRFGCLRGVGAFWGVADLEAGLRVDCLLCCCAGAGFCVGWLGGSSASDCWLSNSGGNGKLKSGCCCAPAS